MKDNCLRDFRPRIHFTPPAMWMNDPNGMVYVDGLYHYCYQYEPTALHPVNILWGHGVSRDLIHWEHLPPALVPDELGVVFSGSAVYDKDNTSGFGLLGRPPIVAVYTSHGREETQSVAYSVDGVTFEKYPGNPVIPNPGLQDFRDPKVFPGPDGDGWRLVLAAGDRVFFYVSADLVHWEKTGEFGPEANKTTGVWECPDLFPLETEEGTKWVLLASMTRAGREGEAPGDTQYFIGEFDGATFRCTQPFDQAEYIDFARDNYAGVTFHNTPRPVMMSWAANWAYCADAPSVGFKGQATLARRLSLVKTPRGYRLAAEPLGVGDCLGSPREIKGRGELPGETFALRVRGEGPCRVVLANGDGHRLVLGVDGENRVFIDRTQAGSNTFSDAYNQPFYQKMGAPRFYEGGYQLEVVFDVSVLEVYLDRGTRVGTAVVYPDRPYDTVTVEHAAATLFPIRV